MMEDDLFVSRVKVYGAGPDNHVCIRNTGFNDGRRRIRIW